MKITMLDTVETSIRTLTQPSDPTQAPEPQKEVVKLTKGQGYDVPDPDGERLIAQGFAAPAEG